MSHTPVLSDLQARYTVADRIARASAPTLPGTTRRRVARQLRRTADRLES